MFLLFVVTAAQRKSESFSLLNKHIKGAAIKVMLGFHVFISSLACAKRQQVHGLLWCYTCPCCRQTSRHPYFASVTIAPAAVRPRDTQASLLLH